MSGGDNGGFDSAADALAEATGRPREEFEPDYDETPIPDFGDQDFELVRESEGDSEPPGGDDWSHSDRKQKCPWCIGDMAASDRRARGRRKRGQRERQP